MRRIDLLNDIQGSILKRHYLEAFLAQSAYIEGMLKMAADFQLFSLGNEAHDDNENKTIGYLRTKFKKANLSEIIDLLHASGEVSDEQRKLLDSYRKRRNKVLHELLLEMREDEFERDLKETCEAGQKIIDSEVIELVSGGVDMMEKAIENMKKEILNENRRSNEKKLSQASSSESKSESALSDHKPQ